MTAGAVRAHARVATVALLFAGAALKGALALPQATITATATQDKVYTSQVELTYLEPVNCTIEFEEDVVDFNDTCITRDDNTVQISNWVKHSKTRYTFQVAAVTNANVTIFVAANTVKDTEGDFNNDTLAYLSFMFYAYPPSATLRLDGYAGTRTGKTSNTAYLLFNSTTEYDGNVHFGSGYVSLSPHMDITGFERVTETMYKFSFEIPTNASENASNTQCVDADADLLSSSHTAFRCSQCPHERRCTSQTTYPPADVEFLEFPFDVILESVPGLHMEATSLPFFYDTLWPAVTLSAPTYAKEPFFLTISWSEDLVDPAAVAPVFTSGPPVDQLVLRSNKTILSPSSYRLLIAPTSTGVLNISINGTKDTKDSAGNSNDFLANTIARTGSQVSVVYSDGPPIEGTVVCDYQRPLLVYEYEANVQSIHGVPSLSVSWDGFVTAVEYDFWISWGRNLSTPVLANLTTTEAYIAEFQAMLGLEYVVNVRARNNFGGETLAHKVFMHPQLDVVANGAQKVVRLPNMLSQMQTNVTVDLYIVDNTFLSVNPRQVITVRSVDRAGGDVDPCRFSTEILRCTFLNFHLEVASTQFLVFRHPIRVEFTFGRHGWDDLYFKPQLRYWEAYNEEWRIAAHSCPPSQFHESWNDWHRIYSVSICHLSQFAIFESYWVPPATTTEAPDGRPDSYDDPVALAGLLGGMFGLLLVCLSAYFVCKRPWRDGGTAVSFDALGIRPVTDRLPSRRPAGASEAWQARYEDARNLLALPSAEAEKPRALEDASTTPPLIYGS